MSELLKELTLNNEISFDGIPAHACSILYANKLAEYLRKNRVRLHV